MKIVEAGDEGAEKQAPDYTLHGEQVLLATGLARLVRAQSASRAWQADPSEANKTRLATDFGAWHEFLKWVDDETSRAIHETALALNELELED